MGGRSSPQGQIYVTAPVLFGRLHVLPVMAALLDAHDGLSARMMLIDRNVRIVEEGIDVAVRIGTLADSVLLSIGIGSVRQVIVASPAYLARHGAPERPEDLSGHRQIGGTGVRVTNHWSFAGGSMPITPRITLNTIDGVIEAAEAGLGIANLLSYQAADAIAAGRLVPLLEEHRTAPVPVSLLFERGRAAIPAVRAFIDAMRDRAAMGGWE
jgi:DNA-binding transcriptional LysR family regulator